MKILHTADWHLGKLLHTVNLLDDQRHVLEQVVAVVEQDRPDAIVISGDVYDRAVPPAEAVELLDWVLTEIVDRLGTPTVMIAGNHDSADRLQFGSALLRKNGLHVVGKLERGAESGFVPEIVRVPTADGRELCVCAIPFIDPAGARELLGDETIDTHDAAMRELAARCRGALPPGATAVLAAHVFAKGGTRSDSERTLSVGGVEEVGSDCFDGFAYTALGHLHRPQTVGDGRVRYSGSILKYSASEIDNAKSLSMVEIDADGGVTVREIPLAPRRDLRRIRGVLADIEKGIGLEGDSDDYFVVELDDETMPLSSMARLRTVMPNTLDATLSERKAPQARRLTDADLPSLGDLELFETFMQTVAGRAMTPEERGFMKTLLDEVNRNDDGEATI